MSANGFNKSRRSLLAATGAAAIGISFGGLSACSQGKKAAAGAEEPKLNFYNWDTYIAENTLGDFEKASGIKVSMTNFATNDELFAKMKTGKTGYDVIVPSNDFVTQLAQANLLLPLDKAKLPNFKNIDPGVMSPDYDPDRKYSVPYTWLTLGLGYRKSKMPKGFVPDSWKYVFDSDMFKGRIALLSESGDLVRLGAKYLGYSVNAVTPEVVAQVEAMLKKQKPNIKAFHSDNGQDMLIAGDVDLVIEYNGDMMQAIADDKDKDLAYIVPKEGTQLNADCLCIPVDAPRPDNAHKFLNYIMEPQVGAQIAEFIGYATPNLAAKALTSPEYQNNPNIFPPADVMAKCEYAAFQGAEKAQLYDAAMTRVKA
ncbi:PotD/PotF family extracellular solute-binding protein [Asticcacaulis sp. AC402]|uniref:ABC transporter substrate-binding protein n=1 Tax=Asticcacaulis sp. AC402 TaxID=1282361 RepID=UPI0003C3B0B7|nr:spermidine/putrescine ABC transporter substrate-binding protein [Asticcacaulis sp. AC402]ESQ76611.1 hypothetical protein ABAC402_02755 [Asticcacaulis sp. AC402]